MSTLNSCSKIFIVLASSSDELLSCIMNVLYKNGLTDNNNILIFIYQKVVQNVVNS